MNIIETILRLVEIFFTLVAAFIWPMLVLILVIMFKREIRNKIQGAESYEGPLGNVYFGQKKPSTKDKEPKPEEASSKRKILSKPKTAMELKILNTLWNRQVNKFPDLKALFTLIVKGDNEFAEAGGRLLADGMIEKSPKGQYYLTKKGAIYCAKNYEQFPSDMWLEWQPLNEENVKIIKSKLGLNPNES